jgi:hypothetical protein
MSLKQKSVLGYGCDPNRAKFVSENWGPKLGVIIDVVTSEEDLIEIIQKDNKKYDIFFLAPGICSLVKQGKLDLKKIKILIDQYQSQAKFINIEDVSLALPILSSALNGEPLEGVAKNSTEWPWID